MAPKGREKRPAPPPAGAEPAPPKLATPSPAERLKPKSSKPTPRRDAKTPSPPAPTPKGERGAPKHVNLSASAGSGLLAHVTPRGDASLSRSKTSGEPLHHAPSANAARGDERRAKPPTRAERQAELSAMLGGGSQASKLKREKSRKRPAAGEAEEEAYAEGEGWSVDKWVASLGLNGVIAAALGISSDAEETPYEQTRTLSREQVESRLGRAGLDGLASHVMCGVEALAEQAAASGADLNHKFHMAGGQFEMAFGSLELFFGGLEGVIGPPQMVHGSLLSSMHAEHVSRKDSRASFTSSNGVTTTSETEWEWCVASPYHLNLSPNVQNLT